MAHEASQVGPITVLVLALVAVMVRPITAFAAMVPGGSGLARLGPVGRFTRGFVDLWSLS